MKVIMGLFVVGMLSLMYKTGLMPEIPTSTESATVEFSCANKNPCTITGTLHKSLTGMYTIHVNKNAYFEAHSRDLVSVEGDTYRFNSGFMRQYPVIGTLAKSN